MSWHWDRRKIQLSLANTAESISIGRIFGALIALIGAGISIMFIRVENEKDWKIMIKVAGKLFLLV